MEYRKNSIFQGIFFLKNVWIGVFRDFFAMSESFLKYLILYFFN